MPRTFAEVIKDRYSTFLSYKLHILKQEDFPHGSEKEVDFFSPIVLESECLHLLVTMAFSLTQWSVDQMYGKQATDSLTQAVKQLKEEEAITDFVIIYLSYLKLTTQEDLTQLKDMLRRSLELMEMLINTQMDRWRAAINIIQAEQLVDEDQISAYLRGMITYS